MSIEAQTATAPVRVSTLELFFDLVFVFTITQVASILVSSPHAGGVARAALELSIIFWMYGGYAWLTNSSEPDTPARRGVLLAAMAAFFVCSLAVPGAFGASGRTFGFGYLAVTLVHAAGFLIFLGRAAIDPVRRFLPWNLLSAGLVLAAGWAHGNWVWALWIAAVCVQLVTPIVIRVGQAFEISAAHFGERHGLVILIVLGESLISGAVSGGREGVGTRFILGELTSLLCAATMWWMYFGSDDELAARALDAAPRERRPVWAITGYFIAHFVMIFGILAVAAGTRLEVHNLASRSSLPSAWLIALGALGFAAGSAGFRLALHFAPFVPRVIAALVCLATVPLGRYVSAAVQLTVIAAVFMATMLVERSRQASAGPAGYGRP